MRRAGANEGATASGSTAPYHLAGNSVHANAKGASKQRCLRPASEAGTTVPFPVNFLGSKHGKLAKPAHQKALGKSLGIKGQSDATSVPHSEAAAIPVPVSVTPPPL